MGALCFDFSPLNLRKRWEDIFAFRHLLTGRSPTGLGNEFLRRPGRGDTSYWWHDGDVPLNRVTFSRLDWIHWGCILFSKEFAIELLEWGRKLLGFGEEKWWLVGFKNGKIHEIYWIANAPECRWKVKCSSFSISNVPLHFVMIWLRGLCIKRKWLNWACETFIIGDKAW